MNVTHKAQPGWHDTEQSGVIQPSAVVAMEHVISPSQPVDLVIDNGEVMLDCTAGDRFRLELTEDVTLQIHSAPTCYTALIEITQGGGYGIVFSVPPFFIADGANVSSAIGSKDVLTITTFDEGMRWHCTLMNDQRYVGVPKVISLINAENLELGTFVINDEAMDTPWNISGVSVSDTFNGNPIGKKALVYPAGHYAHLWMPQSNWSFGYRDFTVEMLVYLSSSTIGTQRLLFVIGGNPSNLIEIGVNSSGELNGGISDGFMGIGVSSNDASITPFDTETHIAFVRDKNILRLYLNGIEVARSMFDEKYDLPTEVTGYADVYIGHSGTAAIEGYVTAFRMTKNLCRYPGGVNFTPPTAPFQKDY
jgi:hypothetical protein